MNIQHQKGIGLVEVMVALLLLAVAVLGFSALQMRAVGATDESLVRTRSTSIVRALSEAMRNIEVKYLPDMKTVMETPSSFNKECLSKSVVCTEQDMAKYTAKEITTRAEQEGFKIKLVNCPGVQTISVDGKTIPNLYCTVIAWGTTNASLGSDAKSDCANDNGIYHRGSTCLIMETY